MDKMDSILVLLEKIYVLNKYCSFKLSINQRIKEKSNRFPKC